jgi:hypothetical protein
VRLIRSTLPIALILATPATAELTASSETGFVSRNAVDVRATPEEAWNTLIAPGGWWNGEHTYSGDPGNMSIDARAGGCFCEKLPRTKNAATNEPAGSVEHMRVIYADPGKVLRLSGGLGPLQSEAANGTLTITLKPGEGRMTHIAWEYVVGGYMRYKTDEIAAGVDKVMAEQLGRLAAKLAAANSAVRAKP